MGTFAFIILGAIAGWLANKFAGKNKLGLFGNIGVGIVGSFIGGFIMNALGKTGITGLNLHSILVATLGAFILIFAVRKIK